jgi:hypothetical protein
MAFAALTTLAAWAANCGAFEYKGFTSGADRTTVVAYAHSEGDEVKTDVGTLTVINRFDKLAGTWNVLILQFCSDRLYLITDPKTNATSTSAFVETLYGFIKERGNPTLSLTDALQSEGNDFKEIEYRWGTPSDMTSLVFSTPAHAMNDVVAGMRDEHRDATQCIKDPATPE